MLETLTNAAATSEQKRVCPGEKEDYMEVRKEDQSVIITFLEKNQQFQKRRPGAFGCDTAEV